MPLMVSQFQICDTIINYFTTFRSVQMMNLTFGLFIQVSDLGLHGSLVFFFILT